MQLRLPISLEQARLQVPYSATPELLRPGHRLQLLVDGEHAYPAMLEAIASATRFVHLETYIVRADRTGQRFAEALCERASAGVDVRLLYDGFGAFPLPARYLRQLQAAGVRTAEYRPRGRFLNWRRWFKRDHKKILVVDGRIGFAGGLNLSDEYAPRTAGGKGWRDTHARIEGPLVADLEEMFRGTWQQAGGDDYPRYPRAADESVAFAGTQLAAAVATDHRGVRGAIRHHIVHALGHAERSVRIASAYFVPDRGLRRALANAARRGVDVRLLLPARSDIKSVQWAGERSYRSLLRAGVRIYQWVETHMHAKTMVVDGVWSTVGSYNLDYISLFMNMEVVVEVVGSETASAMEDMFERDFAQAHELTLEVWLERPWWARLRSWFCYQFRRLL